MPDIKLKNGSGVEQTYTGVDTITVPLADGTGNWTFGLTDEDLVFDTGGYNFYKGRLANILKDKRVRFELNPNSGTDSFDCTFAESDVDDLSHVQISFLKPSSSYNKVANIFKDCHYLEKLPVITNIEKIILYGNQSSSFAFNGCYKLQEEEIKKWYSHFINSSPFQTGTGCSRCYSLRDASWFAEYINPIFDYKITSYTGMGGWFSYCRALEKLVVPVLNKTYATTSNIWGTGTSAPWNECNRLNDLRFETQEDGTPYIVQWKGQTIDLSISVGYGSSSPLTIYNEIKSSSIKLDTSKNIFYGYEDVYNISDRMDLWATRYQEVKNDPDWMSLAAGTTTYNGTSNIHVARLYSRFNHDSMVETINSLPDTSAYLATAGGTNTIKFYKYMGDLTDAGGTSNLTEEEIAVAAAKGWTVTLV